MPEPTPYPGPEHISYNEDSRWCQDHGHTGLLLAHPGLSVGCPICHRLVDTDPRFAAALTEHLPNGRRLGSADLVLRRHVTNTEHRTTD
jgi:hypothetical protein